MEIQALHRIYLECKTVVTDTRKITPGCLFVALKGERFDANEFAAEALKLGAAYVLIDNPVYLNGSATILVEDTLKSLQQLAQYHREYLGIPIIALTGSNGKTTTKELIQAVLSRKYNVTATIGNLNNHIGVPLTLLSMDQKTEIGIVEMGANHQKEIEFLCSLALPDYGYITNFGKAHLEGFGGFEGVVKGKSEMYTFLRDHHKIAFVNNDDALQVEKSTGINTVTFGSSADHADIRISNIVAQPFVQVSVEDKVVKSNLIGLYNIANITAAIAIGTYFEVTIADIQDAIQNYIPDNNRSQLLEKGSNKIILDAYNANPSSMKAALENFCQMPGGGKTAFLGDMFELGPESSDEHRTLAEYAATLQSVDFHLVGTDFHATGISAPNVSLYKSFDEIRNYLEINHPVNSQILIKGSRGMALERLVAYL